MGALPKKKHTVARQGCRRATIKLPVQQLVECKSCHEKKLSHHACKSCGATN
jgi:large subunit ribosomal protein L32